MALGGLFRRRRKGVVEPVFQTEKWLFACNVMYTFSQSRIPWPERRLPHPSTKQNCPSEPSKDRSSKRINVTPALASTSRKTGNLKCCRYSKVSYACGVSKRQLFGITGGACVPAAPIDRVTPVSRLFSASMDAFCVCFV